MRKCIGYAVLGGLLVGMPVWAALGQVSSQAVPALKASFEKSLQAIIANYEGAVKNWTGSYIAALKTLQVKLQKTGDFDGWTAVENELARINADPDAKPGIPPDAISRVDALLALQTKFRDVPSQLALDKNQKIVALSQRYIASLTALQTTLTKQGRMEEALVVNAEIKRVKGSAEVVMAEFELSSPAMHDGKGLPPTEDASVPVGSDPAVKAPAPLNEAVDVVTYVGKAPVSADSTFKPLRLLQTPAMGVKRKLSVSALMTSDSSETGVSSGDYYGLYKSSSGTTSCRARVGLKSMASGSVLSNLIVVVEYYSKEVKSTSGKITPEKMLFRRVTIPKVDTLGVWLDFPDASIYRSSYKSSSLYGSSYTYKSGRTFYGIVVSVYEADKTLIFQAVSASTLLTLAPVALPSE
ncbi:MAG: hypothetical protein FJ222_02635 [Lentisphaerae bacterium]|nr:hypothetical protein [Lentisphaerota bacterium]